MKAKSLSDNFFKRFKEVDRCVCQMVPSERQCEICLIRVKRLPHVGPAIFRFWFYTTWLKVCGHLLIQHLIPTYVVREEAVACLWRMLFHRGHRQKIFQRIKDQWRWAMGLGRRLPWDAPASTHRDERIPLSHADILLLSVNHERWWPWMLQAGWRVRQGTRLSNALVLCRHSAFSWVESAVVPFEVGSIHWR